MTGLRSADVRGRRYAPIGRTPEIRVNHRREALSFISSVTNQGSMRFKLFEGAMTAAILIDFMKRMIQEAKKDKSVKVFLVVDNLKVHHARLVQAWLKDNSEHIEVFYLLSYSPDPNSGELLNANLKAAITAKAPNLRKGQLKQGAIGHLRHPRKSPQKVRSFIQHEFVKYAT